MFSLINELVYVSASSFYQNHRFLLLLFEPMERGFVNFWYNCYYYYFFLRMTLLQYLITHNIELHTEVRGRWRVRKKLRAFSLVGLKTWLKVQRLHKDDNK